MRTAALAPVLAHPAIRGTKSDRAAVAEVLLVERARELAHALGLEDVAGSVSATVCKGAA